MNRCLGSASYLQVYYLMALSAASKTKIIKAKNDNTLTTLCSIITAVCWLETRSCSAMQLRWEVTRVSKGFGITLCCWGIHAWSVFVAHSAKYSYTWPSVCLIAISVPLSQLRASVYQLWLAISYLTTSSLLSSGSEPAWLWPLPALRFIWALKTRRKFRIRLSD